jgi:3-isopropylmalate/(R)-2-methylmalate dehydratase small subunit
MEQFKVHAGVPVPLRRSNVDTDQIIPAVYLKRSTRTGFAEGLFENWRKDPEFVLNREPFQAGSILVVGPDFGTGSSREHAVWALRDYGFKVVIGPRFGPIFLNNAGKAGLLLATVSADDVEAIWDAVEAAPGEPMTVDLEARTVSLGDAVWGFEVDDYTRERLLAGPDDIALTLEHEEAIAAYEATRPAWLPTTLPERV